MKQFLVLLMLAASFITAMPPIQIQALSGADFKAGRIIDDAVFFKGDALSSAQVQTFLESKVPVCDTNGTKMYNSTQTRAEYGASRGYPIPYTCVKDFRQDVPAKRAEAGLCNEIVAGNKSAAEIIYEVGISCGVSQKALLVLLEKEQSLVTDDWPWEIQYRSATGYGCPDTAPCDSEYYGFFNQVYNAARQYKRYVLQPNFFNYRADTTRLIQFNPNSACGGTDVFIENSATAALYNYTPYQPNQAALNNMYGTGDSCSAYGNRNFWRLFNDWFGSTLADTKPTVALTATVNGQPLSGPVAQSTAVTLSWTSQDANSCTLTPTGLTGLSNQTVVTPTSMTTYLVTCSNANSTTSDSVTVNILGLPSANLTANGQKSISLAYGASFTLAWSSTEADSCKIPTINGSAASGSVQVSLTQTTNYSLECSGPGGKAIDQVSVTVAAPTVAYLQDYLAKLSVKAGKNSVNTATISKNLGQVDKKVAAGRIAEAEAIVLKTVDSVNELATSGKITVAAAEAYATAATAYIAGIKALTNPTSL